MLALRSRQTITCQNPEPLSQVLTLMLSTFSLTISQFVRLKAHPSDQEVILVLLSGFAICLWYIHFSLLCSLILGSHTSWLHLNDVLVVNHNNQDFLVIDSVIVMNEFVEKSNRTSQDLHSKSIHTARTFAFCHITTTKFNVLYCYFMWQNKLLHISDMEGRQLSSNN